MTTKKLTKCQIHWAEFLSGFNFVISFILNKENQKADLLIYLLNNLSLSENNDCQQYQLQTILSVKRLEISSITLGKNTTIIK